MFRLLDDGKKETCVEEENYFLREKKIFVRFLYTHKMPSMIRFCNDIIIIIIVAFLPATSSLSILPPGSFTECRCDYDVLALGAPAKCFAKRYLVTGTPRGFVSSSFETLTAPHSDMVSPVLAHNSLHSPSQLVVVLDHNHHHRKRSVYWPTKISCAIRPSVRPP